MKFKTPLILVLVMSTVSVTAIADHCVVNLDSIQFGEYDTFSPIPLDANASLEVFCENTAPIAISIDAGINGTGNYLYRQMQAADGVGTLHYNLYSDANLNSIWGDGTGGTFKFQGIAGPTPISLSVFGRIPSGQNVSPGLYRDSVVITVEW